MADENEATTPTQPSRTTSRDTSRPTSTTSPPGPGDTSPGVTYVVQIPNFTLADKGETVTAAELEEAGIAVGPLLKGGSLKPSDEGVSE